LGIDEGGAEFAAFVEVSTELDVNKRNTAGFAPVPYTPNP